MRVAIVGAGWAGLAAAVEATRAGHAAVVFEAARHLGGRARAMQHANPHGEIGQSSLLDNGQHILIGAYTETLRLMAEVGVDPGRSLLRMPLALRFADGTGLACPDWPAPFDALAGILGARGWTWGDKIGLLACTVGWRRQGFRCDTATSVAQLCRGLSPRVVNEMIEPLCASALNTAAADASGQVFLRVLQDSLLGPRGSSHLLIPRVDLGSLFPAPAAAWLINRGAQVRMGARVQALAWQDGTWQVRSADADAPFDAVVLACPSWEAAKLVRNANLAGTAPWLEKAEALRFEAITTVYATSATGLAQPMLALRASPVAPAQFVFDRRRIGHPEGVPRALAKSERAAAMLAFVVSVSQGDRETLERQVLAQGRAQLGLRDLRPCQTVVEK
ncbi:MAG: desaturase, partial [Rhodoferax sp.]|nr:desaturase [Rhodoferax sp.]